MLSDVCQCEWLTGMDQDGKHILQSLRSAQACFTRLFHSILQQLFRLWSDAAGMVMMVVLTHGLLFHFEEMHESAIWVEGDIIVAAIPFVTVAVHEVGDSIWLAGI